MARLIDADNVKFALTAIRDRESGVPLVLAEWLAGVVSNAPTIDAVPVVRCKDCKHFIQEEHGCNHFGYYSHTPWVDEVDFCSYGERKDNDN